MPTLLLLLLLFV